MSNARLSVVHDPDEVTIQPILEGLHRFGVEAIGGIEPKKLAVLLTIAGQTIGGAAGQEVKGYFYLGHLWVIAAERSRSYGSQLLAAIEAEAFAMGCSEVRLDTMNSNSIPFYKRHGYEAYAQVPEYIPGFTKVFLRKIKDKSDIGVAPTRPRAAHPGRTAP
ncbi:GNAT family N-acetyltransferase [Rugamonas apoptosis]|uniref:GNAT family N-acetyltransferase n=1 Tax=Rugamonas apoptosis TaxID=2758570 RepID=A0A7W2IL88_9BURK|nr:GNAT family N-acetyltransferase [Rugamonas apoptosis]MBA5688309.1 GNAT family N-acetyltransferase [Rugamonas apoptosis]